MSAHVTRDLPRRADVVVVGAGLAGLSAAVRLLGADSAARSAEVVLLEAADAPGGRIRTDVVDGFQLDRGFQLYNPAYPQGRVMFDHESLELRPFTAGVRVRTDEGWAELADPRRAPSLAWASMRAPVGSTLDKARFAAYAGRAAVASPRSIESAADVSMLDALADAGIGKSLLESTLRPFLSGVFLEDQLATSRRFGDFVLRSFARGTPSVPAAGMQALPEQLAARLPAGVMHLNTPVTGVESRSDELVVRTAHGDITSGVVFIATNSRVAEELVPGFVGPATHSVTTWYHVPDGDSEALADGRGILTVDGRGPGRGPVVNTVPLTHAAPEYAPAGAALVSSSALGLHPDPEAETAVRAHLAELYGVDTAGWELLATYPIPDALPAMTPPFEVRRTLTPGAAAPGVLVAGDHRDTSSIQGALASGRRAAEQIAAMLVKKN